MHTVPLTAGVAYFTYLSMCVYSIGISERVVYCDPQKIYSHIVPHIFKYEEIYKLKLTYVAFQKYLSIQQKFKNVASCLLYCKIKQVKVTQTI